jgi:hypothetical protein
MPSGCHKGLAIIELLHPVQLLPGGFYPDDHSLLQHSVRVLGKDNQIT